MSDGDEGLDERIAGDKPERGLLAKRGRSTDDGSPSTLLVVHECDGSWTFHTPGAPGVQLAGADMAELTEWIISLGCAPREGAIDWAWYVVPTGPPGTHHGVVVGGDLLTECGHAIPAGDSVRVLLAPGQGPDSGQICPECAGEAR